MAAYLLDTSTLIDALRGEPRTAKHLFSLDMGTLHLSSVVLGELLTGAEKGNAPAKHNAQIHELTQGMEPLPFEAADAAAFGKLRATMEAKGHIIGPYDLLLAAQAVNHGLTLVTANLREFQRVPGLKCENWRK